MFTYWLLDACGAENTMVMEQVSHPLEYDCHHEAPCMVGHLLEADPEAILALYYAS